VVSTAEEIESLNDLEMGNQLHVDSVKKILFVSTDDGIRLSLVEYSNSSAAYQAVFGASKVEPSAAVQCLERKYGIKTVPFFEDRSPFVLFVVGKNPAN
jgi:hypothetical protein